MQITIRISDIDYGGLAAKGLPAILEDKIDPDGKLGKILSILKKLPRKAVSATLKILPQNTKDDIAVHLTQNYTDWLIDAANRFLSGKEISLSVDGIGIAKNENIELTLGMAEIDYNAFVMSAYPKIRNKLEASEKYGKLFALADSLGEDFEKALRAALEVLPQEKKDEIFSCIVSIYEDEIVSLANSFAAEKEMKLTFAGIEAKKI